MKCDGIKIIQPKMKTTTHGLRSFSYLEAKLLNDLLKEIPDVIYKLSSLNMR